MRLVAAYIAVGVVGCGNVARDAGVDTAVDGPQCSIRTDCPTGDNCITGLCVAARASCNATLSAFNGIPDGDYFIDPDGAGGAAPFVVHCDMTTAGGGWTVLPLKFGDAAFWELPVTGVACTTLLAHDNLGHFESFQTSATGSFTAGYQSLRFVPPIAVKEVRFAQLTFRTGGSGNSMDIYPNMVPSQSSNEGWYFTNTDPTIALGFVYGLCDTPGYGMSGSACHGQPGDTVPANALTTVDRSMTLSSVATYFHMVVGEACNSSVVSPPENGEGLEITNPPDADGIWRKGLLVR